MWGRLSTTLISTSHLFLLHRLRTFHVEFCRTDPFLVSAAYRKSEQHSSRSSHPTWSTAAILRAEELVFVRTSPRNDDRHHTRRVIAVGFLHSSSNSRPSVLSDFFLGRPRTIFFTSSFANATIRGAFGQPMDERSPW